jgi:hypothetical protein
MGNGSGYSVPINPLQLVGTPQEKIALETQINAKNRISKKNYKQKEKICITLTGYKEKLKAVAEQDGKRYHTLASDFVIEGIMRLERKNKKNI